MVERPFVGEVKLTPVTSSYSSEYVEDLRSYHGMQMEEHELRYKNAVATHDRAKKELTSKLEFLQRELDRNYNSHSEELQKIVRENAQERARATEEKEFLLGNLEEQLKAV